MGASSAATDRSNEEQPDRAAYARGRRAGAAGKPRTESGTAYLNGYRIGTETRSGGKPARIGRPRKPTSTAALNPDDWSELAVKYADGHAIRVRWKFDRSRWHAWEDMQAEFREAAYNALKDVCRLAPPGLKSPEGYIVSLLRLKLKGVFAEICSRHMFGERFRPVKDEALAEPWRPAWSGPDRRSGSGRYSAYELTGGGEFW